MNKVQDTAEGQNETNPRYIWQIVGGNETSIPEPKRKFITS